MKRGKKIPKLKLKEQVLFFELLADLLNAGFKLQTALEFIGRLKQSNQQVVQQIIGELKQGTSFAVSLAPYFQQEIIWQFKLAEAHGALEQTIKVLAVNLQTRFEQHQKLKQLLQYPILLMIMLLTVGLFIRYYFIGQLMTIQGTNAPANTFGGALLLRLVIGLLILCGGGWLGWQRLKTEKKLRLLLAIPFLRPIIKYQMGYQFGYVFGLLLKAGQPYQVISNYMLQLLPTSIYYQFGSKLQQACENGIEIVELITQIPYLPEEFALFFVRGKTKQEVGSDLLAYSKLSFMHLVKRYEVLLASIQPIMFLLIAAGIVGLYASMLLPMYQMIGDLK